MALGLRAGLLLVQRFEGSAGNHSESFFPAGFTKPRHTFRGKSVEFLLVTFLYFEELRQQPERKSSFTDTYIHLSCCPQTAS